MMLKAPAIHRIRPVLERGRVVALRTDRLRQRAAMVAAFAQAIDHGREVVARTPAQFGACALVDVDAVDLREHRPSAARVLGLELRHVARDHRGRVGAQHRQIVGRERRTRADDVAAESDVGRALDGQQVRIDHVLDVDPAMQELVDLGVDVLVAFAT